MTLTPCAHCGQVSDSDDCGALITAGWICESCLAIEDASTDQYVPADKFACADCGQLLPLPQIAAVQFGWACRPCLGIRADNACLDPCRVCGTYSNVHPTLDGFGLCRDCL